MRETDKETFATYISFFPVDLVQLTSPKKEITCYFAEGNSNCENNSPGTFVAYSIKKCDRRTYYIDI